MKQTTSREREEGQEKDPACTRMRYTAFFNGSPDTVTAVVFLPMYIHFLLENHDVGKIAQDS